MFFFLQVVELYLKDGTGYDWAGHSRLSVLPRGIEETSNLLPELTLGPTLPTGSVTIRIRNCHETEP